MSDPRYKPRSFCAEPEAFGIANKVDWKSPALGTETQLAAAMLQHEFAVGIRRAAKRRYGSIGAYAVHVGQTPDRLGKVLRGEAIMRLEDLAAAQLHLELNSSEGRDR